VDAHSKEVDLHTKEVESLTDEIDPRMGSILAQSSAGATKVKTNTQGWDAY
jgi:hypothetical protein